MADFNKSKYINEYIKEKYYTFKVQIPKEQKEVLKAHYEAKGYPSLNAYVNDLINRDMTEAGGCPVAKKDVSVSIGRDNNGIINC